MRAAYPYVDDFLPAGTVASLERLGEILAGVRSEDLRKGSEAAAHIRSATTAPSVAFPPAHVAATPADPTVARPLG